MYNQDATYYIPELEEFHIGFEYEWLDEKNTWNKAVPVEITPYGYEQQRYGIRVKYLDREDIESLGWKHEKDYPGTSESFYSIDTWEWLGLDHNHKSQWIRIYFLYVEGNTTLFSGTINNKSEFKKLMKQLGI